RQWSLQHSTGGSGPSPEASMPLGGSAFGGIKLVLTTPYLAAIAAATLCAMFLGGAMYMYMAELVSVAFPDTDQQTRIFAPADAASNALSFIGQLVVVKFAVPRSGIGMTLAVLPGVSVVAFALLAANPVFVVIAVFQVLRRGLAYGLTKPASDMLYSVVSREAKYKAKNFIETAVWRGGDVFATWTIRSLAGIGLTGVSLVCIPVAVVWGLLVL